MKVRFSFLFQSSEWWWERNFKGASEKDIEDRISEYLEGKTLPFDLPISIIKYKICK